MTLLETFAKSVVVAGRVLSDKDGRARIVSTLCVRPPIPLRRFDWRASFEDYDLGDPIGHGATEDEAIADLMDEIEFRRS